MLRLKEIMPDIVIIFSDSYNVDGIKIIKNMLKESRFSEIPIILIGKEEKCIVFEKELESFKIRKHRTDCSSIELKNSILILMEYKIEEPIENNKKETEKIITPKKTILIVDDDVNILRIVGVYLEEKYKIAAVKSGMIALSYLRKGLCKYNKKCKYESLRYY